MAKREVNPSNYSEREQQQIYEYFADIDKEKAEMAAEEIAALERAEVAMYGNMNRYAQG
jgi:roadblock/LC7 domain-containing protein